MTFLLIWTKKFL